MFGIYEGRLTAGSPVRRPDGGGRICAEPLNNMEHCIKQRKHPVHMPVLERFNAPALVFVTLCVQPCGKFLNNDLFYAVFASACLDADAWSIGKYLIMPDHIHLFCAPAVSPSVALKRWVVFLKEQIVKQAHKKISAQLPWKWQSDFWDTQIRSGAHYRDKWNYVSANPVRAGFVKNTHEWLWQGAIKEIRW